MFSFHSLQKVQIHHNSFMTLPAEIFSLPKIRCIDASFNKLSFLPAELKGPVSPVLVELNLSHNKLQSLPLYLEYTNLQFLDISYNHIQHVPLVVLTLTKLHTLNISGNIGLELVPYELGNLKHLTVLGVDDLPYVLNIPCEKKGKVSPLAFLNNRAKGMQELFHYDVVIIGSYGYTAVLEEVSQAVSRAAKRRHFTFLQFRNSNEVLLFQRVLALPSTLYLVLWDCENAQNPNSLLHTLLHLSVFASTSPVIVAATWKQTVTISKLSDIEKKLVNCLWKNIRPHVVLEHVCLDKEAVTDRMYSMPHLLDSLKNLAQTCATKVCVPSSYAVLISTVQKTVSRLKQDNLPFLATEDYFWDIVRSSPQLELVGERELTLVTSFLSSVGSIIHLPSTCLSKSDAYVLDRQWFLSVLSGLLQERPNIRSLSGIFPAKCLIDFLASPYLQPPLPYSLHMFASQHGLALSTSSHEMLIPSMLLNSMPSSASNDFVSQYDIRRVYTFRVTPATFWGRLIAHLLVNMSHLVSYATTNIAGELIKDFHQLPNLLSEEISNWDYWNKGIVVWLAGSQLLFSVQAIEPLVNHNYSEGLEIRVANTTVGMRAMNVITGIINSLLLNWYSELCGSVDVFVPCPNCLHKTDVCNPFLFSLEKCCLSATNSVSLQCPHCQCAHLFATDLVPDLYSSEGLDDHRFFVPAKLLNVNLEEESLCLSPEPSKTVFEGRYNQVKVAVKPFPHPVSNPARRSNSESAFLDFWHELTILRHINSTHMSPYLVRLMLASVEPLGLVFHCANQCSLDEVILDKTISFAPLLRVRIAYQLSVALEALHCMKIIHRHVCLANIMVFSLNPNDMDNIKLGGFSEASFALNQGVATKVCGTFPAPEMCKLGNEYDERVDVFAYAFTVYEILTRKHLHFRKGVRFQAVSSQSDRPSLYPVSSIVPYFSPLLNRCWDKNATKRPFFVEIVRFFNNPVNVLTREEQMLSDNHEFYAAAVHFQRCNDSYIKHVYLCSGILSQERSAMLSYFLLPHLVLKHQTALPSRYVICICCTSHYLWVSFQHKYVQVYAATSLDFVKKIKFNHHVLSMSASPSNIYLGLENGDVHLYNLCSTKPLDNPCKSKSVCEGTPIRVIECLEDSVVCASKRMCYRLHPDTLEEWQRIVTLPDEPADVRCTVMAIDQSSGRENLWVGFRRSQQVLVYDGISGAKNYSINCCLALNMQQNEIYVLTMLLVLDTIWIGLNTGHVLCFSAFHQAPLLLTYFKLHMENVRQLLLLHPSYMGASSIFILDSCNQSSENDHRSLPYSLPHDTTPLSVPVLSCGQGLHQPMPRIGSDGFVLTTNERPTNPRSLHAIVLDGPNVVGAKKLECQAQRKASIYMEGTLHNLLHSDSSVVDNNTVHQGSPSRPAKDFVSLTLSTSVVRDKHLNIDQCDDRDHSSFGECTIDHKSPPLHPAVHLLPLTPTTPVKDDDRLKSEKYDNVHVRISEPKTLSDNMKAFEKELFNTEMERQPSSHAVVDFKSREAIDSGQPCAQEIKSTCRRQECLTMQHFFIDDSGGEDDDLEPYVVMRSDPLLTSTEDFDKASSGPQPSLIHSKERQHLRDLNSEKGLKGFEHDPPTSTTTHVEPIHTKGTLLQASSKSKSRAKEELVGSVCATHP